MATRRCLIGAATIAFFSLAITIPAVCAAAPPPANSNHTVGGAAGWNFNLSSNATSANYSAWAASQTFNEHDWMIFNTSTYSSFIQTYNETTYNLCDASDDGYTTNFWIFLTDTLTPQVRMIEILFANRPTYFFALDGQECLNGMKFEFNVLNGTGFPSGFFNQPPPPPPPMTTGGGGGPSQSSQKSGVEGMQGGMVWIGLVLLSLGLMAV